VQIKAFTQWINQTLRDYGGNLQVADLEQDFKDGLVFIRFFSALEPEKNFPKYIQNPKLKVHKLENINKAFAFMEKEMGVRNPGIQAEDVLDKDERSNLKLILGLIWVLFRKYRIAVVSSGSSSAEEGLLNWVKEQTEGYKGVSITKWKDSFSDGLAFAALVHHYDPAGCGFDYNLWLLPAMLVKSWRRHSLLLNELWLFLAFWRLKILLKVHLTNDRSFFTHLCSSTLTTMVSTAKH
jgi:hypothetical protein